MKKRTSIISLALMALMPLTAFSQVKDDSHMEWWRDARYGMFIHWGLFSIPGGEWMGKDYGKESGGASAEWLMHSAKISGAEYRKTLAPKFNPTEFDAEKWVSTAKAAGMKYIVITSKHHDGFCMFDTDATDYNVMDATPFKRDIIKELADECAKQDMKFGVYYSQFKDWYHRGNGKKNKGTLTTPQYLELVKKNLDELLSNYGDMAVLWFDVGGGNLEEANEQGARVRELNPKTVICSRLYSRQVPKKDQIYADFESLPDRTIASERMEGDNETCMTMRHNWGYDQDDDNWKSTKDIIERMVLSSARGVNFLLNVAPTPQGTFAPEEIERLAEIGEWMKVNGDSIYGTHYSPVDFDFPWGAMTQKDQTVYLHVMKWNPESIEFNGLVGAPTKAYFLADEKREALEVAYDAEKHVTRIKVPAEALDSKDTVIALEYGEVKADPNAKGEYLWSKSTGVKHDRN
ncbi:MAG: alpha-L-fucosidase [Akkermansiaceae bacterium]|jgi:alpha-L-fucosidase|nr:alpha-L-fucosidase [Akkermansiaceae bacterium]MDP4722091.1 alpha-L-fucosidase [Akkermansiaceae bacterium]MDP4781453.1 alpha-L-fucosidase [Akkermansiaceae bacterium]MDP4848086.1 alpha-L-fucosidase [Akkermansiaceae bacterium]MDP4899103.1 alpha-L-fucosidase [Akkermansiaceae bacterium]